MKILVIGDSCEDIFIYGDCSRLAPAAPVPVFVEEYRKSNKGMAGNVFENITSLGETCEIITNKAEIIKTRYVEKKTNHMLLRVDSSEEKIDRIKNIDLKEVERPSSLEEFLEDPLFDQKVKDFFEHLDFKPLKSNAPLQKGDVISMRLMHHKPSHVAVFVGDGEIAHHSNNRLSCREAYSGYYLSCTEKRYRYAY